MSNETLNEEKLRELEALLEDDSKIPPIRFVKARRMAISIAQCMVILLILAFVFWFSWQVEKSEDQDNSSEPEISDADWITELQIAEDENFPLLPESPHLETDDGLTPEQALDKFLAEKHKPAH
jgi:hypothetical protein